ncbi:MAG: PEFG-CTERM sorting domain-containing protein [Thaumarchaeota archaeon]|nr:PEFG-CTERM sorting domain-containing protein [Nitrososphaerota archaeon]MBT5993507.1 PEFG-CTERM sorting domain-containing protein [Nitrososphaerota archaeon]MBT7360218.1 PEFG-CTERM sorting domain-containing protein [Nitrososphaerota archaeon]
MKELVLTIIALGVFTMFYPGIADAGMYGEVYIPEHEFIGFFDENGTYTIFAGVKNKEYVPIIPTVTISIQDGDELIVREYRLAAIMPENMLPMKVQIPEVSTESPILLEPTITYEKTTESFTGGYIIYDDSLQILDDGNLVGKIRNGGEDTFEKFRIYALIKDKYDVIIDIAASDIYDTMKPGEVFDFKLMANPSIADKVDYYSCFAFGDDAIQPLTVKQNDDTFTFRYTANAWFTDAEFSNDGSELNMYSLNGFQLPVVGSFEFPTNSLNEKYDVILDGEKFAKGASSKDPKIKFTESVETLQSIDEMGNWHLYFEVPEAFQGNVKISGFMENDGTAVVPDEIDLTTLIYHEIEGGEVIDITAKPKKASLIININSMEDGELLLKINDFLVRPFDNGEFIAQIHSKPGLFNEEPETLYITDEFGFENGLTITIPFKKGTEKIEIFGSYVVPEFGQMVMIVLAATIIGIVVISKKTNSFSNLFYTKM